MDSQAPIPVRSTFNPADVISAGIDLLRSDYWVVLLAGLVSTAILSAAAPALAFLIGPISVGMHRILLRMDSGLKPDVGDLFKPFDNYLQNMIPGAYMIFGTMMMGTLIVFIFGILTIFSGVVGASSGQILPMLFANMVFNVAGLALMGLVWLLATFFQFAFPLQAEHGLNGTDAVMLSIKAAKLNFWRLAGLNALLGIALLAGGMFCGIGWAFVLPVVVSSQFIAYRRIFQKESEFDF